MSVDSAGIWGEIGSSGKVGMFGVISTPLAGTAEDESAMPIAGTTPAVAALFLPKLHFRVLP
jgi:hypothetical protein